MKNTQNTTLSFCVILCLCTSSVAAQQWDTLAPIPERFTFPVVDTLFGKIHIMGGGGVGGATDHHYAYDPATNTWDSLAPVPYRAQQPAGAAVNGKIHYFGGGFPNTGTPLDDHYIYDPETDTWEQAASLTSPRAIHYAVTLDSVLYSLAGQGKGKLCQTYDAEQDSWINKNNLPDDQFWYGAHVATGGHIYRFCGGGYVSPNNKAHRYDPDTDTWEALPNFPNATHAIRGAAIGDKIFLAGGYYDFTERDEVWIFDTQTEEYSQGIPLPLGRSYHNMVAMDSCLYVLGGSHAIDETVGTQLLRLCPYEKTAGTGGHTIVRNLKTWYDSGRLYIEIPEETAAEAPDLALFDISGRQILHRISAPVVQGRIILENSDLISGMYVVHLRSNTSVYTGKVIVQRTY